MPQDKWWCRGHEPEDYQAQYDRLSKVTIATETRHHLIALAEKKKNIVRRRRLHWQTLTKYLMY